MNIMEKTKGFIDILSMDDLVLKDLYIKYSLLADAYIGSAGKEIVENNRDTFEIILGSNIRDYMQYMYASGSLSSEIASNPNLGRILDGSSQVSIEKIAKSLEGSGWAIKKEVKVNEIQTALSLFGIQSATDISGSEILDNEDKEIDTPQIEFDDINDNELIGGEGAEGAEGAEECNDLVFDDIEDNEFIFSEEDIANMLGEKIEETEVDELSLIEEVERSAGTARDSIKDFNSENAEEVEKQIAAKDKKIDEIIEAHKKEDENRALDEALEAESQVDKSIVQKTVKTIMASYDILYAHLFQETPAGILTSNGIITVKSDNSLLQMSEGKAYAIRLYQSMMGTYGNSIREADYHDEISMDCINPDGTLKYNYAPNFHIRNIYGIYRSAKDNTLQRETNWEKFRLTLIKSLTKIITGLLEKFKGDILALSMNLIELFTTVFIVEEFDINKVLKMSMKSVAITMNNGDLSRIGKMIASGEAFPLDTSSLEVVNNTPDEMGVHNLLVVFDKKIYNGEILFAYKPMRRILESGGKLGLKQTLLGRSIKGKNITYNFESPQAVDSLIIAGSGSGKGVVTLNILATFIAEGCPTVYVDWKPEMAAMLWDLERATGARILAVDGLAGNMEGIRPVRDYGTGKGVPSIPGISDKLNVIPYIKTFQTMILCARARNMGYNGMTSKSKKMQFILDEAQAMNKQLSDVRSSIEVYMKENKVKKGEPVPDELVYVKKLKAFVDSMFSGAVQFRNTTGRTGNVGLIMLGQQSDCTAWANGALKRDPIGFLVGNCSMKMLGKDAVDGNKYSLNGCVPIGNSNLGNMGYFALVKQAVADRSAPDKISVVKTYLVLNENDYKEDGAGKYTGGLLKNIEDDTIRSTLINEDLYPMDENGNNYTNPMVGFKGLVEYIGSTIPGFNMKANLEAGYIEVEKLLSGLGIVGENGRYSCIEEYLFDCSPNGIFTIDELAQLMQNNETIADLIEDFGEDSESGAGSFSDNENGIFSITRDNDELDKRGNSKTTGGASGASEASGTGASGASGTGASGTGASGNVDLNSLPRDVTEMIKRKQELDAHPERIREEQGINIEAHYSTSEQPETGQRFTGTSSSNEGWAEDNINEDNGFEGVQGEQEGGQEQYRDTVSSQPEYMAPNEHKTFDFGGRTGRAIYMTPEKTSQVLGLTKDNSILVTMPPYSTAEKFHKRLFGTLWGSKYEFKNRWRAILDGASGSSKADLITRVIIMEDIVVFNKKQVATINILGGDDDIRIQDIVDFKLTAKKFKNVRELLLDEVIFETAQIELSNIIDDIFKLFNQLQRLTVMAVGCGSAKISITRQQVTQNQVESKAQDIQERAQFKNQMEAVSAAKNPNLRTKSPGYQSRVWEASKKFQGQGWGAAKNALLEKNPRLFKAAGLSVVTAGVLAVGGIFGLAGRIGSLFRH